MEPLLNSGLDRRSARLEWLVEHDQREGRAEIFEQRLRSGALHGPFDHRRELVDHLYDGVNVVGKGRQHGDRRVVLANEPAVTRQLVVVDEALHGVILMAWVRDPIRKAGDADLASPAAAG